MRVLYKECTLRAKVQAVLDELRPYVQADGGDVELVSAEDGVVTVRLSGNCAGCPSSSITLKHGIEKHLLAKIPEVKQVVQAESAPYKKGTPLPKPVITSPFSNALTGGVSAGGPEGPSEKSRGSDPNLPVKKPASSDKMSEPITAPLRAVHRRAEALLDELDALLVAIQQGKTSAEQPEKLQRINKFLNTELQIHMRQEDEVLFPALIPFISWGSPMSTMAKEHQQIHDAMESFSDAVAAYKTGSPATDIVKTGRDVSERLRDDFFQEENVLFVEADGSITGPRAAALREAMERIARAAAREN